MNKLENLPVMINVFAACLLALAAWALINSAWEFAGEKYQEREIRRQAIERCIEDNASPHAYMPRIRDYCEEIWHRYAR